MVSKRLFKSHTFLGSRQRPQMEEYNALYLTPHLKQEVNRIDFGYFADGLQLNMNRLPRKESKSVLRQLTHLSHLKLSLMTTDEKPPAVTEFDLIPTLTRLRSLELVDSTTYFHKWVYICQQLPDLEHVKVTGGWILLEEELPNWKNWLARQWKSWWSPQTFPAMNTLQSLSLSNIRGPPPTLMEWMASLTQLVSLELWRVEITSAEVNHVLPNFPALTRLEYVPFVQDKNLLLHIANLPLTTLRFQIDHARWKDYTPLFPPTLTELDVMYTVWGTSHLFLDATALNPVLELPQLETLYLRAPFSQIVEGNVCTSLRTLCCLNELVGEEGGVPALFPLFPRLTKLEVLGSRLSARGFEQICQHLPLLGELEDLALSKYSAQQPYEGAVVTKMLLKMRGLKRLTLPHLRWQNEEEVMAWMEALSGLDRLEQLVLNAANWSPEAMYVFVESLHLIPSLQEVVLGPDAHSMDHHCIALLEALPFHLRGVPPLQRNATLRSISLLDLLMLNGPVMALADC